MERLTKQLELWGHAVPPEQVAPIPGGYAGEAIERLARFENFYCDLLPVSYTHLGRRLHLKALRRAGHPHPRRPAL